MLTKSEITERINLAWDAVSESRLGPIAGDNDTFSKLGFETFIHVLESVLPKFIRADPPKESWQE